ncbi:hypothetical protein GCM10010271_61720 [Streptomyces kurssanovii]|nr:hypothetical protein GCM10010271_61720 [Streptomyces kurssanovii]
MSSYADVDAAEPAVTSDAGAVIAVAEPVAAIASDKPPMARARCFQRVTGVGGMYVLFSGMYRPRQRA